MCLSEIKITLREQGIILANGEESEITNTIRRKVYEIIDDILKRRIEKDESQRRQEDNSIGEGA